MVGDDSSSGRDRDVLRRAAAVLENLPRRLSPRRLFVAEPGSTLGFVGPLGPLHPGVFDRGQAIARGDFTYAGETVRGAFSTVFARSGEGRWSDWLNGFEWLGDLRVVDADARQVRAAVDAWIAAGGERARGAEAVLAWRLLNWLASGQALFGAGDLEAQCRVEALMRQVRRLEAVQDGVLAPLDRLAAAAALAGVGVCFTGAERLRDVGLEVLAREVERQILPDGGHVSRSPRTLLKAVEVLSALDVALAAQGRDPPPAVRRGLDRARPMLHFFRQPDGGLPAFHGSGAIEAGRLAAALAGGPPAKPFGVAPHSGFHRVEIAGLVLIVDVGGPAAPPDDLDAHASPLAFTLATPTGRLMINCGWSPEQPLALRDLVRGTAAHTALTIDDAPAAAVRGLEGSGRGPRTAPRLGALTISARRNEEELGVWIEGAHEGYRARYGLAHRRRLFVAAAGGDLRGEDILFRPLDAADALHEASPYAIRFHLAPEVRPVLARDRRSATLTLPSGECWRFRTDLGPLGLEDSLDASYGASPTASLQLVIAGSARPDGAMDRAPNRVRWALQRLGRAPAA